MTDENLIIEYSKEVLGILYSPGNPRFCNYSQRIMKQPVMDNIKEKARAISEAYEGSYTESGLVAALRELVTQLSYTHLYLDGDHGIEVVNVRDIYKVIQELEGGED